MKVGLSLRPEDHRALLPPAPPARPVGVHLLACGQRHWGELRQRLGEQGTWDPDTDCSPVVELRRGDRRLRQATGLREKICQRIVTAEALGQVSYAALHQIIRQRVDL